MSEELAGILLKGVLALPVMLFAGLCLGIIVFTFRAWRHANKLDNPPAMIAWNPLSILFRPDVWTEEAEQDCLRHWYCVAGLVALFVLLWAGASLVGLVG